MFGSILVPTDGSTSAEAPIAHALELARVDDATIHALYVVDGDLETPALDAESRDTLADASEKRGQEATVRIENAADEQGFRSVREVREGAPHTAILEYAEEQAVDLIVMGTHGRTGAERVRLGSTTERVIMLSDVPVVSVPLEAEGGDASYDRIVIPTDGSDAAERAAATALDVAEGTDATVHVVYVVDTTTYELEDAPRSIVGLLKEGGENATSSIAEMARDRDLSAKTDVRRGQPASKLLEYASAVDADLLVMGTRGQALGTRGQPVDADRLLGSTTARVVRRSSVPVLTVR
ncbi:universal stress protein [Natronosalvus vescus]|uniref:universal stress protein n=1 Tax=Natronosalvus vescus TaxID=2953881 RepID=UPI00273A6DAD